MTHIIYNHIHFRYLSKKRGQEDICDSDDNDKPIIIDKSPSLPFGFQHKRCKTQNDTTELTANQEMRRKLYVFQQNIDQLKDISGNILNYLKINDFKHLCFLFIFF